MYLLCTLPSTYVVINVIVLNFLSNNLLIDLNSSRGMEIKIFSKEYSASNIVLVGKTTEQITHKTYKGYFKAYLK
jgi:hypothetical protein